MSRSQPHPRNAPGDFYVEAGNCIACGAPEREAPELMAHDETEHCYFQRQPATQLELEHAIQAVWVSCCEAVQYGGEDANVLSRLAALRCKRPEE